MDKKIKIPRNPVFTGEELIEIAKECSGPVRAKAVDHIEACNRFMKEMREAYKQGTNPNLVVEGGKQNVRDAVVRGLLEEFWGKLGENYDEDDRSEGIHVIVTDNPQGENGLSVQDVTDAILRRLEK